MTKRLRSHWGVGMVEEHAGRAAGAYTLVDCLTNGVAILVVLDGAFWMVVLDAKPDSAGE